MLEGRSGRRARPRGHREKRVVPSVSAPKCLETSGRTKVPALWSCTNHQASKSWGQLRPVFAGSTRIGARSLTYQRAFGEVLWVIKKHEKRT